MREWHNKKDIGGAIHTLRSVCMDVDDTEINLSLPPERDHSHCTSPTFWSECFSFFWGKYSSCRQIRTHSIMSRRMTVVPIEGRKVYNEIDFKLILPYIEFMSEKRTCVRLSQVERAAAHGRSPQASFLPGDLSQKLTSTKVSTRSVIPDSDQMTPNDDFVRQIRYGITDLLKNSHIHSDEYEDEGDEDFEDLLALGQQQTNVNDFDHYPDPEQASDVSRQSSTEPFTSSSSSSSRSGGTTPIQANRRDESGSSSTGRRIPAQSSRSISKSSVEDTEPKRHYVLTSGDQANTHRPILKSKPVQRPLIKLSTVGHGVSYDTYGMYACLTCNVGRAALYAPKCFHLLLCVSCNSTACLPFNCMCGDMIVDELVHM